jgi:hypothetical protein
VEVVVHPDRMGCAFEARDAARERCIQPVVPITAPAIVVIS